MAHAVLDEKPPLHMGLPISNGKLAMWLFLVTEIMFFTGLIGTYLVLRNGSRYWVTPHQVHLVEWMGAVNTFVLICSSLAVVLAHSAISKGQTKTCLYYIAISLGLGFVFLGVKAIEYAAKFEHHILPGADRLGPIRRAARPGIQTAPARRPGKDRRRSGPRRHQGRPERLRFPARHHPRPSTRTSRSVAPSRMASPGSSKARPRNSASTGTTPRPSSSKTRLPTPTRSSWPAPSPWRWTWITPRRAWNCLT